MRATKSQYGQMDCLNTGNKLCNVTFQIGKGKARESRARCILKVEEEVMKLINRLSMIIKEILFLSILIIVLLPIIVS